jgi:hypothetical protein
MYTVWNAVIKESKQTIPHIQRQTTLREERTKHHTYISNERIIP